MTLDSFWNDTIPLRNNRIVQCDSMLLCVFYRIFCMGNNGHQVTKHGTTTDPTFANRRHPGALPEASGPADLWNTICVHMDRQPDTQRTACSCKNSGVIGIFVSYWPMCCLETPILRSKGLWRLRAQVQSKLFGEIFRGVWVGEHHEKILASDRRHWPYIFVFFFVLTKHFSDREVQSVIVIPLPWKVQCLYICSWNFIHQDLIFHGVSTLDLAAISWRHFCRSARAFPNSVASLLPLCTWSRGMQLKASMPERRRMIWW